MRVGNCVSEIVTVKSSVAEVFPFTSVAVQVTVVVPTLKTWLVSVVTVPVVAPLKIYW